MQQEATESLLGAWLALGVALVADVALVATGRGPITAALRTWQGKVFLGLLVAHVMQWLGPYDPFKIIALTAERLVK